MLTPGAMAEILHLREHIRRGCLSGIPAKAGSEKNENLHRNLCHIVARSKLGVKSAVDLFTSFFYQWNERKEQLFDKGLSLPSLIMHNLLMYTRLWHEVFGIRSNVTVTEVVKQRVSCFLQGRADVFQMHCSLPDLGIAADSNSVLDDMKQLRLHISKEWEQNASTYQELLPTSDLNCAEEVIRFQDNGYYVGE